MNKVDRRSFLKAAGGSLAAYSLMSTNSVTAVAASCAESCDLSSGSRPWSLVILPDTQCYARWYPGLYHLQTQWVLENKDKYNIVYALQNGDVTDDNSETHWKRASGAFARLDSKVPYAFCFGNHDFGLHSRESLGNSYFPVSRFEKWPTFGGLMNPGKMDNTFHVFKAAGQDYLILCLEFGPRDEVLEWANQIVKKHPDHKVIMMTHAYLYHDSTRYDWHTKGKEQNYSPYSHPVAKSNTTINDGQEMWDKLVKKHPNMFMVISGHVLGDGLGFLTSKGDNGNNVHQMLVNYQMQKVGGGAWLRILTFYPDKKTIEVKDYSPLYEKFNSGPENEFVINI